MANSSMKSGFKIVVKIIAIALVISAGLTIYLLNEYFNEFMRYGHCHQTGRPVSVVLFGFLKHYNAVILICFTEIVAGFLILFNQKTGWMFAIITLVSDLLFPAIRLLSERTETTRLLDKNDNLIFYVGWFLVFGSMLAFMLLKAVRFKYAPTIKTYVIIAGVSGLILIDYLLHI
jgi:hypothetical protein